MARKLPQLGPAAVAAAILLACLNCQSNLAAMKEFSFFLLFDAHGMGMCMHACMYGRIKMKLVGSIIQPSFKGPQQAYVGSRMHARLTGQ